MEPISALIRQCIDPAWGPSGVRAVNDLARYAETCEAALAAPELAAERLVGEARFQEGLIAEARAIVAGTSRASPEAAHLWALLDRLERYERPALELPERPF